MRVKFRWCLFALLLSFPLAAQQASIRGRITDESGAVVPAATITIEGPQGVKSVQSGGDGAYVFLEVAAGGYTVKASAAGLILRKPVKISLGTAAQTLNLLLNVATGKQELTVEENGGAAVGLEASANASAIVLRGADLDALSDNPDDLAADLQALAGPAAGPNGGAFFIDGFSGGQLPPKSAIREVRINQNPFSPEYEKLGFGRIEIFTKPGSDKYRATVGYNFANDKLNSRNAYAAKKAPFHLNEFTGTLSGPLNKRSSFNVNVVKEWVDNGSVINGVTLDPQTLAVTPFDGFLVASLNRLTFTPRVDYQLSPNHTLAVRYAYSSDEVQNAGVGGINLASRGYHFATPNHTVQATETAVVNNNIINETRFQYFRPATTARANTDGVAIQVLGAFNGGGNPVGQSSTTQNSYEIQNYTSMVRGAHAWRFGVRLRNTSETSISEQNFAGTLTYSGGLAPQLDLNNKAVIGSGGQAVLISISSIESYRRTLLLDRLGLPFEQIRQLGGGATQFSINTGNPLIAGSQFDLGLFAGDEWRVRPNVTLSLGLRYEGQSNIHDWRDWAPRVGLAWAPGSGKSRSKSVIRAGLGMFYDRFALGNTLTANRFNGIVQRQQIIQNPSVLKPVAASAATIPSSIEQISNSMRAPYLIQSALGFERQLPLNTTIAITYANSHGLHLLRSRNINSPLAGTYKPTLAGSGVFPFGRPGLVALMESSGLYNQNQLIINVNAKVNRSISLTGSYMYNRALSNTDGLGTFPADPYSMDGEYGPAATDMHHRVSMGGTITPIWGIRLNPLLSANSGPPFDITAGRDIFGNTLYNGRPSIASNASKQGVVVTKYGLLDPNPAAGDKLLPRNYGRGPGQIMLNLRIGRTFAFGTAKGEGAPSSALGGGGAGPVGGGGGGGGGGVF